MTPDEHEALNRVMLTGMTTDWHTLSRAVRERDELQARLDRAVADLMAERRLAGSLALWLEGSTGAKVQIVTIEAEG